MTFQRFSTRFFRRSVGRRRLGTLLLGSLVPVLFAGASLARAAEAEAPPAWLEVVRQTPYWASRGVAENLSVIRTWILFNRSYCHERQRHLLFDYQGRFLAYVDNGADAKATQERLDRARKRLVEQERADDWRPGDAGHRGYPFALSCHQPFADIGEAIDRLTGESDEYRVWGTWDGITVGRREAPVSLIELFKTVYEHREAQGRFSFPDSVLSSFLGKVIIESGGQKDALSREAAKGIMQLRPEVLDDCGTPPQYHLHRMAQVDCALRLVEQNHRNLQAPFEAVFGDLPRRKREHLYGLLLTQAYQIGVGRTTQLLKGEELGKAARYFARHHQPFNPEDIQVGMIYHNLGRRDIGLRTLYYVTDTRLAQEALCASAALQEHAWCP